MQKFRLQFLSYTFGSFISYHIRRSQSGVSSDTLIKEGAGVVEEVGAGEGGGMGAGEKDYDMVVVAAPQTMDKTRIAGFHLPLLPPLPSSPPLPPISSSSSTSSTSSASSTPPSLPHLPPNPSLFPLPPIPPQSPLPPISSRAN